ncbi:Cleavage and polyadenylation specificity factor subunit 4 [Coemansia sp. RSA 2049]|nr:Cleavage and polyadenylation specificity factor subunit 4 [Coemansia sp. RSA 2049]KAJ2607104.1 Cleavage and polyadenylation specificity factor subunit 4 [Coemansia sp. RSA 1804]KAJ2690184.1 Cleavage and polyadenylation specificity factor subunit 4 [Coemansia sp. RSA 1285]
MSVMSGSATATATLTAAPAATTSTTAAAAATATPSTVGTYSVLDTQRSADTIKLDFEDFVRNELKLNIDHVPATQRARSINDGKTGVCNYFLRGHCWKGNNCIYRHLTREQSEKIQSENRTIVCKHWLRGLCKKDDDCDYLHEYNLKKMPECTFFPQNGKCTNGDECPFQHLNPEQRVKECLWYARGFCKHGAKCRSKHVRKLVCPQYRAGFCPLGPSCPKEHPRFDLPLTHVESGANAPAPNTFAANAYQQQQQPPQQHPIQM